PSPRTVVLAWWLLSSRSLRSILFVVGVVAFVFVDLFVDARQAHGVAAEVVAIHQGLLIAVALAWLDVVLLPAKGLAQEAQVRLARLADCNLAQSQDTLF